MDRGSYRSRVDIFKALLGPPKAPQRSRLPALASEIAATLSSEDPQDVINLELLKKLCLEGIPDEGGFRPTCWKLLLGYLPLDKSTWIDHLSDQRQTYYSFVRDLVSEPGAQANGAQNPTKANDHPLSAEPFSTWDTYFKDTAILEQIDIDIRRTLSDVDFFQRQVPNSPQNQRTRSNSIQPPTSPLSESSAPWREISAQSRRGLFRRLENKHAPNSAELKTARSNSLPYGLDIPKHLANEPRRNSQPTDAMFSIDEEDETCSTLLEETQDGSCDDLSESPDFNWEAMERILFIYAKLNPGVGYVQGMNELIGTLYYVCANDTEAWHGGRAHAEADAFFLFTAVMGLVRDQYVREFDNDQQSGVQATLGQLEARLQHAAPRLACDLKSKKIDPTFYAFRWITVLGTLEFPLPDVIRLWDGLFAYSPGRHPEPIRAMVIVSVAMVVSIQDILLNGTFSENIHLLQHFPPADIPSLLTQAWSLDKQFHERLPESPKLGIQNLNLQRHLTQLKSLIDGQRDVAAYITPKKETIFKSWNAAKRFIANTHNQPI
ncbi:hypothetical protein DSO57_1017250 [Entomophthora muscae]|uniref:Uncharacterized protein n=1 Tax=Entomophthora muscae TaxID=34485 RepID=A0ACC2TFK9_9FUNG|nr:hypothetical protein DSO57_1017250 [Entomophthora muscae]